jgi:protein gp37
MADVFERRAELAPWRERLWGLIEATPSLDWLLLTKRPHNVRSMTPWGDTWPENVWLGTTVENQTWADKRIPSLLENPAKVRFLSCEPLLGILDLENYFDPSPSRSLHWVIAGGESGARSRPMNPEWVRSLRNTCQQAGVAFHFKQWGHWAPEELLTEQQRNVIVFEGQRLAAVGKGKAGRSLDGRTWDELPFLSYA